jgi:hypothetical protein
MFLHIESSWKTNLGLLCRKPLIVVTCKLKSIFPLFVGAHALFSVEDSQGNSEIES